MPRTALITQIEDTLKIVDQTLENLDPGELEKEYPILVFKEKATTGYFLTHLATHLGYHLGQVNYHTYTVHSLYLIALECGQVSFDRKQWS